MLPGRVAKKVSLHSSDIIYIKKERMNNKYTKGKNKIIKKN